MARPAGSVAAMLTATRGRGRFDWTDWLTYGYLLVGLVLMFGPVLWLVLSSFKSAAAFFAACSFIRCCSRRWSSR